ncbi:MAG: hypothetical protein NT003_05295 [Candidatus Magasanikbacteria bacterium]|nr:hypothetical protein [Candidatus Magasanikbacteria bacterium]
MSKRKVMSFESSFEGMGKRGSADDVRRELQDADKEVANEIVIDTNTKSWSGNSYEENGVLYSYTVYYPKNSECVWYFTESYRAEDGTYKEIDRVEIEVAGSKRLRSPGELKKTVVIRDIEGKEVAKFD